MKQVSLTVQTRESFGRSAARKLREQRRIPGVVYGASGVRHFSASEADLRNLFKEIGDTAALIELQFGADDAVLSLIQDAELDPLGFESYIHLDMKEVVRGQEIDTVVPVHLIGEAFGVKNQGALLEQPLHEIELRARPSKLPSSVDVDVSGLKEGDFIHVSDLPQLEGVTYLMDGDVVVAACTLPSATKAADEEEADPSAVEATKVAASAN